MITEDYVSFEIAKLLKEKGFNERVRSYYISDTEVACIATTCRFNSESIYLSAPTLQMTMKWLREVHDIAIDTEWEHLWYAYVKPMTFRPTEDDYYQHVSPKYEEACEAAIKYCLEKLI